MNAKFPLTLAAILGAALTSDGTLYAQNHTSPIVRRGMASAWSAGMSLAEAPGVSNDMILKHPNPSVQATTDWVSNPAITGPDYSIEAMFGAGTDIQVDAHSSGNGTIPRMDDQGQFYTGATTPWVAIIASAGIDAQGTGPSLWRRARNRRNHAGAELVGYYLSGSTGLNNSLPGNSAFEGTRPSLNFTNVGPDLSLDIDALDYGIGMFTNGLAGVPSSLFMNSGIYFFSLSPEWCSANSSVPFAHLDNTMGGLTEAPDPRIAYRINWTSTGGWSEPFVALDEDFFGLAEGDNLDAFDVDLANDTVIFSSMPDGHPSQVMFTQLEKLTSQPPTTTLAVPPMPMPGALNGSGPNTEQMLGLTGTTDDDVRSLCGIDPEGDGTYFHVGIPKGFPGPDGQPMGLSMSRVTSGLSSDLNLLDDITLEASGWGDGTPALSFTVFQIYTGFVGDPWATPTNEKDWAVLDWKVRAPTDDIISMTASGIVRPSQRTNILLRARNHTLVGGTWVVNGVSWNIYSSL